MPRKTYYGWLPDLPDIRDRQLPPSQADMPLPVEYELDPRHMPEVRAQGRIGASTAFAVGGALEFLMAREVANGTAGVVPVVPSHLFIYYQERVLAHTSLSDSGAQLRDTLKVCNRWGVPHERYWPYEQAQFTVKPSTDAYEQAELNRLRRYSRLHASGLKAAIYSYGPVCLGMSCYASFESEQVARTGVVPMPSRSEELLGGLAVWAYGWTTIRGTDYIRCRNSWGPEWGDKGNFYLPEAYTRSPSLTGDMWSLSLVS